LEVDQEATIVRLDIAVSAGDLPVANPTAADRPAKGYGRSVQCGEHRNEAIAIGCHVKARDGDAGAMPGVIVLVGLNSYAKSEIFFWADSPISDGGLIVGNDPV
jgi:hypothetical protein